MATIALDTGLLSCTIHEMSELLASLRSPTFGSPYEAWRAPTIKRKVIMRKDPESIAGRRPNLSR